MKNTIFTIFILFFTISCTTTQKGYYFIDENKINNFDVYNFTKQDLIDNIGLPSTELSTNTWLYYSYTTKNLTLQGSSLLLYITMVYIQEFFFPYIQ